MIKLTRKQSQGMTLLEMTVVILVLLGLVGILFIGARAWVRGSSKASCIANIRKVQQAVRSYQNLNNIADGVSLDVANDLTGTGNFIETPTACPAGGTYSYGTTIPSPGTLMMTCTLEVSEMHIPPNHAGW